MPQGFNKPTENSSPEVMWKFIQDKYVRKLYVPKNALDPVSEYKEQLENPENIKKPSTPPTDDDSIKSTKINKKSKHVNEDKNNVEEITQKIKKVDINQILDIDITGNSTKTVKPPQPIITSTETKPKIATEIFDLFDNSKQVKPAPYSYPAQNVQQFVNNYKYSAFDQLAQPKIPQMYPMPQNNLSWANPLPQAPLRPANFYVAPLNAPIPVNEVKPKKELDKVFADILPKDLE